MAAKILKGEKASDIPYETIEESQLYINSEALASYNIAIPEELASRGIEAAEE